MTIEESEVVAGVRKWLVDQGYPLEMRTARTFRRADFTIEQSTFYESSEGKAREIDVVAVLEEHWQYLGEKADPLVTLDLHVVCECKSGPKAKKPWVVFTAEGGAHAFGGWPGLYVGNNLGRSALASVLDDHPDFRIFRLPERCGYAVANAHTSQGDHDPAFAAVAGLANAAHSRMQVEQQAYEQVCRLVVPTLVVSTPVVECWLDGAELQIEERDQLTLLWRFPVAKDTGPIPIVIVHETAVDRLAQDAARAFERILSEHRATINHIIGARTSNPLDREATAEKSRHRKPRPPDSGG